MENVNEFSPSEKKLKLFRFFFSLFFLIFFSFSAFSQGHEIKIRIASLKDSSFILGHHFGGAYYPDDTARADHKGLAVFKGSKPLPEGMYFIYLPTKKVFDIILGNDQVFSLDIDSADFVKTAKFTGSVDNEVYYNRLKFFDEKSKIANELVTKKKDAKSEAQKDSCTKAIDKINQEVLDYENKLMSNYKALYIGKFIKALKDVPVPDAPRDASGKITDSTFQYRYYRAHYFDNFDYTDPSLLRSQFYEAKVKNYFEKVIPPMPDSVNMEIDKMLDKTKGNQEVFRYLLVTLFNMYAQSQIMGYDAVFVHISEKYYIPYATWADKDYMDKLKKEIAKIKPNIIGNTAPNLKWVMETDDHFIKAKTDTALKSNPYIGEFFNIHDIKADYLILAFWEADCGHCKKAMPELYKIYNDELKNKGVKVIALHMMSTVEGKRKWIDFVNEHSMYGWINAWSPYTYEFKDIYNVYTTPVIYVLDKNKKILAKKISPEQARDIINLEISKKAK